ENFSIGPPDSARRQKSETPPCQRARPFSQEPVVSRRGPGCPQKYLKPPYHVNIGSLSKLGRASHAVDRLSAEIVPFPNAEKSTFSVAREAWLKTTLAHPMLTDGNKTVGSAIFLHFNYEHFDKTGELIAWPSWQTLMTETALGKTAIHESIAQLEQFRLLEVERGRYDHTAQRRAGNIYHVPPRFAVTKLAPRF